ncbi:hypothetical protein [Allokutzneria albata]|uniref:FhuF 2Fe-2S C-terminal domain-containing protein n=1 Tax=Allokutzneria albata TaxID=211114 RepID=A0A1H0AYL3_ALLAB|nr:hypothetical protein [Allokutzneria albata]SDN38515.1 hypothetical protein SAMN04489726_6362 [Allokutzneria albata]
MRELFEACCPEAEVVIATPPPDAVRCADLVHRPEVLRSLVDVEERSSGHILRASAARTLLSCYAIRLCQVTIMPTVIGDVLVHPDGVHLRVDGHGFTVVYVEPDAIQAVPEFASGLVIAADRVLDGHMRALAKSLSVEPGCAWSPVAGQIGFGLGTAMARARAPMDKLLEAHRLLVGHVPWLANTGRLVESSTGDRLVFLRSKCCLWWTIPVEDECRSCPRRSDSERTA